MKKISRLGIFFFLLSLSLYLPKLNADSKIPIFDSEPEISMDFQDANLKDVLKVLSIQSGLNFIASEAVEDRKMTLYLDKVPIKDAMDKLFKANNLEYVLDKDSNIFIVKDLGKPQAETITKVFYLKYCSVSSSRLFEEISNNITSSASTGSSTSASSAVSSPGMLAETGSSTGTSGASGDSGITAAIKKILSKDGTVTEDYRTNSLIVSDLPARMPLIAQTIAAIDVPVSQVLIEVEILDVSKNIVDKMGFKFGQTPFTAVLTGVTATAGFPFHAWDKINNPAYGSLDINSGTNTYTTTLDFLRTQTDTKILARPRILTLNNETAEIKIVTNETVGTVNTTSTGGGQTPVTTITTERVETGVSLRVTPQINAQTNEITMFIMPTVRDTTTSTLSGVTAKDPEERSTKSIVRLRNGETVVIGGLIRNQSSEVTTKLPILGDIPLLGLFFRHKSKEPDKERELLVFITPRIINDTNKNLELAQAKKVISPIREQDTAVLFDRNKAIGSSLDSFEKKNK